jgi:hypothetical protein
MSDRELVGVLDNFHPDFKERLQLLFLEKLVKVGREVNSVGDTTIWTYKASKLSHEFQVKKSCQQSSSA